MGGRSGGYEREPYSHNFGNTLRSPGSRETVIAHAEHLLGSMAKCQDVSKELSGFVYSVIALTYVDGQLAMARELGRGSAL